MKNYKSGNFELNSFMKRILHLISSLQGSQSYSVKLGKAIVEKIQEKYPASIVEEVNLVDLEVPHLNPDMLQSFFKPGDQLTAEEKEFLFKAGK